MLEPICNKWFDFGASVAVDFVVVEYFAAAAFAKCPGSSAAHRLNFVVAQVFRIRPDPLEQHKSKSFSYIPSISHGPRGCGYSSSHLPMMVPRIENSSRIGS